MDKELYEKAVDFLKEIQEETYENIKTRFLEETKDLKHLVRFMFFKYAQSKDCDELAGEIMYQRCKEFGIFDD